MYQREADHTQATNWGLDTSEKHAGDSLARIVTTTVSVHCDLPVTHNDDICCGDSRIVEEGFFSLHCHSVIDSKQDQLNVVHGRPGYDIQAKQLWNVVLASYVCESYMYIQDILSGQEQCAGL